MDKIIHLEEIDLQTAADRLGIALNVLSRIMVEAKMLTRFGYYNRLRPIKEFVDNGCLLVKAKSTGPLAKNIVEKHPDRESLARENMSYNKVYMTPVGFVFISNLVNDYKANQEAMNQQARILKAQRNKEKANQKKTQQAEARVLAEKNQKIYVEAKQQGDKIYSNKKDSMMKNCGFEIIEVTEEPKTKKDPIKNQQKFKTD